MALIIEENKDSNYIFLANILMNFCRMKNELLSKDNKSWLKYTTY